MSDSKVSPHATIPLNVAPAAKPLHVEAERIDAIRCEEEVMDRSKDVLASVVIHAEGRSKRTG